MVLAFDVGTSGVRPPSSMPSEASSRPRVVDMPSPHPSRAGSTNYTLAIRAADGLGEPPPRRRAGPSGVAGVVVTAQMLVQPVDARSRARGTDAQLVGTQRAAGAASDLADRVPPAEQARRLGGLHHGQGHRGARALWLRDAAPERYAGHQPLLDCKEAVVAWGGPGSP